MAVEGYVNVNIDEELKAEVLRLRKLLEKSINAVSFLEKSMRQLQLDNPDSFASWPQCRITMYRTIDDWVDYVLSEVRR